MLENTWYTVISPESCSSILWRSWDFKETAAEALKLTPEHMLEFELIDDIIKEPLGGLILIRKNGQNAQSTYKNGIGGFD